MIKRFTFFSLLLSLLMGTSLTAWPDTPPLRIAVASNFHSTLKLLITDYQLHERQQGKATLTINISSGSTGQLYAQIIHGAPFDIFLAADKIRPQKLYHDTKFTPTPPRTYALGELIAWSPSKNLTQLTALKQNALANTSAASALNNHQIIIANPKTAPYGKAAQQVLQGLSIWDTAEDKIIRANSVSQAHQFLISSPQSIGFIARSQAKQTTRSSITDFWLIPKALYAPIEQQAVLLNKKPLSKKFYSYIFSDRAQNIIRDQGYELQ